MADESKGPSTSAARLTPEREKYIRVSGTGVGHSAGSIRELLAEIDALREERDAAIVKVEAMEAAREVAPILAVTQRDEALTQLASRDALVAELAGALEGVLRVADRKTVEFDAARAALEKAREGK